MNVDLLDLFLGSGIEITKSLNSKKARYIALISILILVLRKKNIN